MQLFRLHVFCSVNSHKACHNPKTLTGKILAKHIALCYSYARHHEKWLAGANFPQCFFSFSHATDMARTFRLIVQLHRLIHIGKLTIFSPSYQGLAAGGAKKQKGGNIFEILYWMYASTREPNVKWGPGHHWPSCW